ncbi:hypothetical protein [Haloquadratum walsbyi]|uniref:DUF8071 domain-containing protein n=1 Tax=Haloquadratum walsbyi J07HQW2 TaxID=1238425 RepID=U1PKJ5_9EURY|nr:hypothetical protein [Haloquadratum walsbyi]ERG94207.1 MAG: hypothetical protein J07HQW2_00641 [Haloquadratum walsbyi J07HQW2]
MRSDWSPLQTAVTEATSFLVIKGKRIAGAIHLMILTMWNILKRLARALWSLGITTHSKSSMVLSGPVKQFVTGPLWVVLLGKRRDVSLLIALLSPVLALVTAWWVGSTVGYETLTAWVRGTWFGTEPSLAIFLGVSGLLVLGAISAGINSGLLPTGLLVGAPIFGAAVTRYGTTVTYTWGSQVVSLPNAVGIAVLFALGFGVPATVSGLVLGRALRNVVRVYGGRSGPSSAAENA